MTITVQTVLTNKRLGHAGIVLVDPYTEDRDGHLYLVAQDGQTAILCDGIVSTREVHA